MKVCWLTNVQMPEYRKAIGLDGGFVGGWMESLLSHLKKSGVKIDLSVLFLGDRNDDRCIDGVAYYSIKRNELNRRVEDIVKIIKPNLIHLHGSDGISLLLNDRIFELAPVAVSIQGIISGYWPHYMGGLTSSELNQNRNLFRELLGYRRINQEADYWRTKRSDDEKRIFRRCVACFGRTDWDCEWARMLAPQASYFNVGEIMRAPFYKGIRNPSNYKRHSIYSSAALSYPLKGGHWLLRAVASLKSKYSDIELRVANAKRITDNSGIKKKFGKNEYYRFLENLIEELGIKNNVVLLPGLRPEEVRQELENAEVFCLPSMIENSPNSLGEAMLTGTPSVATFVGGIPTIARNGIDALLVQSGDCAMMAKAIDNLFSNPSRAEHIGIAGYESATKRYNPENVVSELLEAYKSVVNQYA